MRVIPVIDLRQGLAVHAVAGDRAHYGPLRSVLHEGANPLGLAGGCRDRLGLTDLYLADLDAILGEAPPDTRLYRSVANLGLSLWLDAGVRRACDVLALIEAGVEQVVVGLETIQGTDELATIVERFGSTRVVFSLDLRDQKPLVATPAAWGSGSTIEILRQALDCGIRRIIRLDLADVGTGGTGWAGSLGSFAALQAEFSDLEWLVGGGITRPDEIQQIGRAGGAGVLIGSALHDGRINSDHLKLIAID